MTFYFLLHFMNHQEVSIFRTSQSLQLGVNLSYRYQFSIAFIFYLKVVI